MFLFSMAMCMMEAFPITFIWHILWSIVLLTTSCESGNLNTTNDNTTTTTTSTTTSTAKVLHINLYNVILCQCDSGEVLNNLTGQCQHWAPGTTVPMKPTTRPNNGGPQYVDTTELIVTVKEPQCLRREIDLQEGEFILRKRGDLIVTEGTLHGLRVEDYCIQHKQSGDKVKLTARGCVSVPDIPRCCPFEKHMVNGECILNTMTSIPYNPSLFTGPHGDKGLAGAAFPWTDRKEHIHKLSCAQGQAIKKIKLDDENAYLSVLPQFVLLTYQLQGEDRQYSIPPNFCVDVPADDDIYYAYICQKDPISFCKDKTCTNKCCPQGQAILSARDGCVSSNLPFNPPFISHDNLTENLPENLTTLYGYPSSPSCKLVEIDNFQLLQDGTLKHREYTYTFDKFCTDNFIKDGSAEPGGLACILGVKETLWHSVRKQLFPVCLGFSCVFLALLLLLHAWIPKLRAKEGKYQLFHAGSLLLAYSVTLALMVLVPNGYIMREACLSLGFVMQFAFLSAFFWLNIMCFDVWRLFRNLLKNMFNPHSPVATWKYLLYAVGGPLAITLITILIQCVAPSDESIPWLVHPRMGEGRCWFRGDKELLVYFYGPIAVLFVLNFIFIGLTYHYLKTIRGDYNSDNDPSGYTINSAESTKKYDFFAAFWQRFYLLVVVAGCWLTEILSWKIPPEELWALTDLLNNLQGVLIFFVFLTHHNKRALLKEKLPKLFQFSDIFINHAKTAKTSINNSTRKLSTKLSSSSIISNMTSFSSFSKSLSPNSSFNLNKNTSTISTPSSGIRSLSLTRQISKPLDTNTHPGTHSKPQAQNQILRQKNGIVFSSNNNNDSVNKEQQDLHSTLSDSNMSSNV